MKTYIGTKTVKAKPMTRGEYNAYRGWAMPADENGTDAGYLVEYIDGGKANDSRHAGYISWSPGDVFERAYREVPTDYRQRVRDEHALLTSNLDKLRLFLCGEQARCLPDGERHRMSRQCRLMSESREVLGERIAAFPQDGAPSEPPTVAIPADEALLDFGSALDLLKQGVCVARLGWNGKGMFVYLVPADRYPAKTDAAKAYFGENGLVPYNAYLAIKNADGTVSTWVPSVNDCLADDWVIVLPGVATIADTGPLETSEADALPYPA